MSSLRQLVAAAMRRGRVPRVALTAVQEALVDQVPAKSDVAIVETESPWLGLHLAHRRRAKRVVVVSDDGNAEAEVTAHKLSSCVEIASRHDLEALASSDCSVWIVSGRGGEEVIELVSQQMAAVMELERLVVHLTGDVASVRGELSRAGLQLTDECLVPSHGGWQTVLTWGVQDGAEPIVEERDLLFGPILRGRADPELRRFLGAELVRVARALATASSHSQRVALAAELDAIERELARLALVEKTILKG